MAQRPKQQQKRGDESMFSSLSPTMQDLLCVGFIYLVTLVVFRGIIFDNAAFEVGGDTAAANSYLHAGVGLQEKEGVDVLWMPFFFSGMPTFGNVAFVPHYTSYVQNIVVKILNLLYFNGTWTWLVVYYFLAGVFMFFLMRVLKFPRIAALFAAFTFMLSPYAVGQAGEGHGSKLMALSYLPLVFTLTHLLFERRNFLSFGLLAAAVGTLMLTNHMQIVYYVFIVVGLYLLYHVILDFPNDKARAVKKVLLLAGALVAGGLISSYIYLSVYEYAQFSMRGGGTAGSTGGLTWEYATNWSWNPWEIITLLIPSFFGLRPPYYWGPIEPWTASTVYVGVLPILLSIVAVVYRRTRLMMFFVVVTVLAFLISFGRNLPFFYDLLFTYLPFFNKFRAPSMILHLIAFTFAILGGYGLTFLMESIGRQKEIDLPKLKKVTLYGLVGVTAILILGLLLQTTIYDTLSGSMFMKEGDAAQIRQQYGQRAQQAIAQVKQVRFELFWKDTVKFLLLAGASLAVFLGYLYRKLSATTFGGLLVAILLVDLMFIDAKLITPQPSAALEQEFRPDATITFLKQQEGLFRIFPLGELFSDNTFAYHGLQSIGGYSPAKLKIYQTMIDSCLYRGPDPAFPLNMSVVDMLNVKYLVAQGRLPEDRFELVNVDQTKRTLTYRNPHALPRAFYVSKAVVAANDVEVFRYLDSPQFDPSQTAILQTPLPVSISPPDSGVEPKIVRYESRTIVLATEVSNPTLMVLSEVYYPAGWKAYIDGAETEIFRTNTVLRSVVVPPGKHEVVFRFDPPMYRIGWLLTNCAWGLAGVCILVGLWRIPAVRTRFRRRSGEGTASQG